MNTLNISGFILEFGFVAIILLLQFWFFIINTRKRKQLGNIFPKNVDEHFSVVKGYEGFSQIEATDVRSDILTEDIIKPINAYLEKNKGATDYHIIKDLSDRACDKIQDEVDSYNPIPLYLGLCGTMLGIIFGIVFLWLGGGLDSLLTSASSTTTVSGETASQGIRHLLGGVAVAMIASLAGVVLTIISTHQTKNAVAANESGRNRFLSWIQSNLLPTMSSDVVSTLGVFYQNLNEFNGTFATNSQELKTAFQTIQEAYRGQTEYTKELNKLDIAKAQMAFAALGSATDKINDLNAFLSHSSQYLANVVELSQKLDTAEERTKAIERMGEFFKEEIEQIQTRKVLLSQTIGQIDLNLKQSLEGLKSSTTEEVNQLQTHLNKVYLNFKNAVSEQQRLLAEKLSESSLYLDQFRHLETIEEKLATLLSSGDMQLAQLETQNGKLDRLIEVASKKNTNAGSSTPFVHTPQAQDMNVSVKLPIPKWLAYLTCIILIAAGLFSIIFPFIHK